MGHELHSHVPTMNLEGKTVLLRADLNVPLKNGAIAHDFKLRASQPTIDLLLQKGALITLATHLGRPKNKEKELSTQQLIPWLERHGYKAEHATTPQAAQKQRATARHNTLVLLENLRFFPGEQTKDQTFAKELADCGRVYINDAFGALHRNDTSLTRVPKRYTTENKTIGMLVEKELQALDPLRTGPAHPFVVILGGNKLKSKLPFFKAMLRQKVDALLLCPAFVFTAMKGLGIPVGKSLVEDGLVTEIKRLFEDPRAQEIINLPLDFQIARGTTDGPLEYTTDQNIPQDAIGVAIGPKTLDQFAEVIKQAGTVFFNGPMGFFDRPDTLQATNRLLQAISESDAYTVVGGGDAVAASFHAGVADKINFLSTGGGATLAFLARKALPGLQYMR